MRLSIYYFLLTIFLYSKTFAAATSAPVMINPGEQWLDDRGVAIQAHGGGVIKVGDYFYWFGEDRTFGLDRAKRYVGCYRSADLIHWTFRRRVEFADPEHFGPRWVLERPKVFPIKKTGKFVMYMHVDSGRYSLARVGVAVSDTVDGDYKWVTSFRPLGHESRDIGQFIDDDGSNYLLFEDRPNGFHIAKLSEDGLSLEKDVCDFPQHLEGLALVHDDGLYYVVGSELTGWRANPNKYATAKSLSGPWSEFKNIAPPEQRTYGSQSAMLLKIAGSKNTAVIFMGDIWRPWELWDSRYLWMPVEIGGGKFSVPPPKPWRINVKNGEIEK